jgi:Winged helix DNA-binding domain
MTLFNIPAWRIENQRISHSKFQTAGEVVHWLGAIQAQDYASAEWSVGLRLPDATQASVDQALDDGSIVRTWMLRGTLHFVAGADVGWMLKLLAPKVIAGNARRYKELELDEPTMMRANGLLADSFQQSAFSDPLENQTAFNRGELLAMLEENGIATKGQRGIYLLQRAALDGLLCRGVTRSGDDLYMALRHTPAATLTREEALAELARRYFQSHGPATFQDFMWWTGLKTGDAREGFEAIKSEFVGELVDGQTYWMADSTAKTHDSVYLLPGFDEYMLGYKDRGVVLDADYADRICPGGNGVFYPTIVSRGRVVGTWKRAFKKGKVMVTPSPFPGHEIGDFEAAAATFAAFVGLEIGE